MHKRQLNCVYYKNIMVVLLLKSVYLWFLFYYHIEVSTYIYILLKLVFIVYYLVVDNFVRNFLFCSFALQLLTLSVPHNLFEQRLWTKSMNLHKCLYSSFENLYVTHVMTDLS